MQLSPLIIIVFSFSLDQHIIGTQDLSGDVHPDDYLSRYTQGLPNHFVDFYYWQSQIQAQSETSM